MPDLGVGEILIIVLVLFALFGYRRLPDAARSIGRSLRVLRAETRGLRDDDVRAKAEAATVRGPLGEPATADTAEPPAAPSAEPPATGKAAAEQGPQGTAG